MKTQQAVITTALIQQSMNYQQYRALIDDLLANNQTTGGNHSEAMLHYTKMNVKRMKRLDKTVKLLPEVADKVNRVDRKTVWLTITEAWCGDAAQILPVIEQMANLNENIEHRMILRDEHPEVMNAFLTNGSKAIPKTIFLDGETLEPLDSWGPRPKEMQEMMMAAKAKPDFDYKAFSVELHKKYALDKTRWTQLEFVATMEMAYAQSVANFY